ncbi:acyl transferase/acyl hydrolase/lysophospholipase [Flagelloscypha sp. PMI_526]|nr:acyl transferase/acyl hydrolase/lysophospholipase [Flagelloscypha sp. PMI_526]
MSGQGIRILVVDGEGSPSIGVASAIDVLDEMISRIAFNNDVAEESIRPCEYFDLIVGSGDGGWIALMLGRLGMSASRAKTVYEEIHSFIHRNCASLDPQAKAEAFEPQLKKLVCRETGETDPDLEKLQSSRAPNLVVNAVLTKSSLNIGAPVILRTYRVRDNKTLNCPIWAAIRACTARPNIFPETNINGQKLISASLGHNNPIESALQEARVVFQTGYIDSAIELSQGSEVVSQEFAKRQHVDGCSGVYFRFNAQQGLQAYAQADMIQALRGHNQIDHTSIYYTQRKMRHRKSSMLQMHLQFRHMSTPYMKKVWGCLFGILSHFASLPTRFWMLHKLIHFSDKAKPVEIGDIGILTKFGAFEVLFNATLPAASQKKWATEFPRISNPYISRHQIFSSQGLDSASTTHKPVQQCFNLSFAAMNGAALIIKDPPTEVAITPERRIED